MYKVIYAIFILKFYNNKEHEVQCVESGDRVVTIVVTLVPRPD